MGKKKRKKGQDPQAAIMDIAAKAIKGCKRLRKLEAKRRSSQGMQLCEEECEAVDVLTLLKEDVCEALEIAERVKEACLESGG